MRARFTSMAVLHVALWALVAVQVSHVSAQGQRRSTEQVPSGTGSRRLVWNCAPRWISTVWPATTIG